MSDSLERKSAAPKDKSESKAPLLSHLQALRKTVLFCMGAVLTGFLLIFFLYADPLIQIITAPLTERGIDVIFTGVSEAFGAKTKLSLIVGVTIASPLMFLALWLFIRPGLRVKERKTAGILLICGIVLFGGGIFLHMDMFSFWR